MLAVVATILSLAAAIGSTVVGAHIYFERRVDRLLATINR